MSIEDKMRLINNKIRINQIKAKLVTSKNKNTFNMSKIKEKYSSTDCKLSFIASKHLFNSPKQKGPSSEIIQSILSKYLSSSDMLFKSQEILSKAKPHPNTIITLNKNMLIESIENKREGETNAKPFLLEHQNDFNYATAQTHKKLSIGVNSHFIGNLLTTHENYEIIKTDTEKKKRSLTDYSLSPSSENRDKVGVIETTVNECFTGEYPIKQRIAFVQREKKIITHQLSPGKKKGVILKDEIFDYIKEYIDQNTKTNRLSQLKMSKGIKVPILIQRTPFNKPC